MYTFSDDIYFKWISPLISEVMLYNILKPILEDKSNSGLTLESSHTMADESSLRVSLLPKLLKEGLEANGYNLVELAGIDGEALLMIFAIQAKMQMQIDCKESQL